MNELLQHILNGLVIGGTYSLIGMGSTLIFGIMRIVNFAHGEFYMLGAFVLYTLLVILKLNFGLAMILAFLIVLIFGYFCEKFLIRPLRSEPMESSMLMTIGISIVLQNAALLIWGGEAQTVPKVITGSPIELGPLIISAERFWIFIIALIIIMGTHLFITKTKIGRGLRATFQDKSAAEAVGVNIEKIYGVTFGVGAALAAAGGFLLAPIFLITPTMGTLAVGKAFAVVTIGGLGNIKGAILGGLLLGVVESLGAGYISSGYKDAFSFIVIILVLLIKPAGLLAKSNKRREC